MMFKASSSFYSQNLYDSYVHLYFEKKFNLIFEMKKGQTGWGGGGLDKGLANSRDDACLRTPPDAPLQLFILKPHSLSSHSPPPSPQLRFKEYSSGKSHFSEINVKLAEKN